MKKLPTVYQEIIHLTKYARWIPKEKRRETWEETVGRLITYLEKKTEDKILKKDLKEIQDAILNLEVMPSMRLLMTAGDACEVDNIAAYNCGYIAINNKRAFSEVLHALMCGTGIGFSCERDEIKKLPEIPDELKESGDIIVVADSKRGWAVALKKLLSSLWEGDIPTIDLSRVRPAGSRLKTFGGKASGPQPLQDLFRFTIETFKKATGRKLNSIEVHDIVCMIGQIVVVGGVRRSALISLSNLTDRRMRDAKSGQWWVENVQRKLANNSVVYTEKPDVEAFMEEWLSLVRSKSGERGIFNRVAAQNQASRWGRRSADLPYGCNPCSEILLRNKQFCNLTEVVTRGEDTYNDLKRKVRLATILGTIQSTLTNFQFLSEEWTRNTEEERLLGVSITGIMDNVLLNGAEKEKLPEMLEELRDYVRSINKKYSEKLGISESAAITCVKPSGTVSQLVDSASGIHPRHAPYYIRRIRLDSKDYISQFLKEEGVPNEKDVYDKTGQTDVFSFPFKGTNGAVYRSDRNALEQLELWLTYQRHWCEHKPSCTIYVKEHEWPVVGAWVWEHFDEVSGISFLPFSEHTYQQPPYEDIDEDTYNLSVKNMPVIDWSKCHEEEDNTEGSQELACVAGGCEI